MLTEPLDNATFGEAVEKLGKREIVGLVHVIGAYKWVSLLAQVNNDGSDWI